MKLASCLFYLAFLRFNAFSFTQKLWTSKATNSGSSCGYSSSVPTMIGDFKQGNSLEHWAMESGIIFADGTQIRNQSIFLTKEKQNGDIVITIPRDAILSSESYDNNTLSHWANDIMGKTHLSECLLMLQILEEKSKGEDSRWCPFLRFLESSAKFSTAIYFDEVERSHVQRMAPKFMEQTNEQWQACSHVLMTLIYGNKRENAAKISETLQEWLLEQTDLEQVLKWAFSVVFTQSWKSVDGQHAILVPFAGMLHHDIEKKNVQPCAGSSGGDSLQLCYTQQQHDETTGSTMASTKLCMSYGIGDYPARFLVGFGFVDYSAPYIDAHIDFEKLPGILDWPAVDTTQLVISTKNGAISQEIWNMFLYKVLQEKDPIHLETIKMACEKNDVPDQVIEDIVDEALMQWEADVANEVKMHLQSVLDNIYTPMFVNGRDFEQHEHLRLIWDFNLYMREIFMKAIMHVNMVLQHHEELQQMGSL